MGNNEEGKSSASDKSSPAQQDQTNIHVYPDWAAMQAYYGSRVALPPYYNSAVASGHALILICGAATIASSFLFHLGRINEVN
uniref:G-box binding protein multifunctional mosaic region domain-containing protein n=1 Tax=Salix viminalis TaxID=40686 RepID=A0A6N2KK12_SALVM